MKAIILSAGKGTRLKGINDELPKVLLPLFGRSMLERQIELLKKHGIKDIAINTHHLHEKIREKLMFGGKYDVKIKYSYEPELLGTSGSLNNFKEFFDEPFIVIYGDVISKMDLSKLIEFHKKNKSDATLVVHKTDHPEDSDVVRVDKKSRVLSVHHKPGNDSYGDLGNAALYVVEPCILKYLPYGKSDFIKDIFPKMIKDNKRVFAYNTKEFIKDAGTPKRIKEVEKILKKLKNTSL